VKYFGYLILMCAWGCHSFKEAPPVLPPPEQVLQKVDTTLLPAGLQSRASVLRFYALTDYTLHWTEDQKITPMGDSLIGIIGEAQSFGLSSDTYHLPRIRSALSDSVSVDRFLALDVMLTDAWLTLYSHLKSGQLEPVQLHRIDYARSVNMEAITSLQHITARSIRRTLNDVEPLFAQYQELKRVLSALVVTGGIDSAAQSKAQQLALNLERWRWQAALPKRYISVNIPAFMLRVYDNDSLWLETRVIVGKRETPTPVMKSVIRSFIIYPYWHVPRSIATKEILPALQREASYLRRNNFEVLDRAGKVILADTIQWDFYTPDNFPFILRQREGSENSMGIIKFNFANNYGVYLHDTNSKRLFQRDRRDLSHGCVRVSNAVAFAHYLVREDDIYVSPEDLDQYLSLQQRLTVDLRNPIPLHLEYFTAEVLDGVPAFYNDIYKKDSVMMRAMYPPPIEEVTSPLAAEL
jgi:L,D-transpeptidase YcbB